MAKSSHCLQDEATSKLLKCHKKEKKYHANLLPMVRAEEEQGKKNLQKKEEEESKQSLDEYTISFKSSNPLQADSCSIGPNSDTDSGFSSSSTSTSSLKSPNQSPQMKTENKGTKNNHTDLYEDAVCPWFNVGIRE